MGILSTWPQSFTSLPHPTTHHFTHAHAPRLEGRIYVSERDSSFHLAGLDKCPLSITVHGYYQRQLASFFKNRQTDKQTLVFHSDYQWGLFRWFGLSQVSLLTAATTVLSLFTKRPSSRFSALPGSPGWSLCQYCLPDVSNASFSATPVQVHHPLGQSQLFCKATQLALLVLSNVQDLILIVIIF